MGTIEPAAWLADHEGLLPRRGAALDVACGSGRHALWLAARGLDVRAVDRDEAAVRALIQAAAERELPLDAQVVDLERDGVSLGDAAFDLVVVFNYLHRPLFPALLAALRPGGVLVYETFTREQARHGRPTNPDYLLKPGELRRLIAPLSVLAGREGEDGGRWVASVIARRER
jgi:SAM-dependent methyltransferase